MSFSPHLAYTQKHTVSLMRRNPRESREIFRPVAYIDSHAKQKTNRKDGMNKYNVQAIRRDLDAYVRVGAWKKFRVRFDAMQSTDVKKAVILLHPHRANNKRRRKGVGKSSDNSSMNATQRHVHYHNHTLLHGVCHSVSNTVTTLPLEVLDSLVRICSELLSCPDSTQVQQKSEYATPLSIALQRRAPPDFLQCLLLHDGARDNATKSQPTTNPHAFYNANQRRSPRSLYAQEPKKGDTALLQAVKDQSYGEEVIHMLVEADKTRGSLLVANKKDRIPLFYVAKRELEYCDSSSFSGQEEEKHKVILTEELEYLLLQTEMAIRYLEHTTEINNQSKQRVDDISDFEFLGKGQRIVRLVKATITCSDYLSEKHFGKIMTLLLIDSGFWTHEVWKRDSTVMDDGCTLLHHVAKYYIKHLNILATFRTGNTQLIRPAAYSERSLPSFDGLVHFLLKIHPQAAVSLNRQGKNPLHVALDQFWCLGEADGSVVTQKNIDALLQLLYSFPLSSFGTQTRRDSRLPLHIAMGSPSIDCARRNPQLVDNSPVLDSSQDALLFVLAKEIWKLHPEAAATPESNGFYPFQLAALPRMRKIKTVVNDKHAGSSYAKDSTKLADYQLSTIFMLLRASPEVLAL